MPVLHCIKCSGEGRIFKSKYSGNDPDVWDAGKCEACDGSGNQECDARGCNETATASNDDGEYLCQDCFQDWALAANAELG